MIVFEKTPDGCISARRFQEKNFRRDKTTTTPLPWNQQNRLVLSSPEVSRIPDFPIGTGWLQNTASFRERATLKEKQQEHNFNFKLKVRKFRIESMRTQ